jgi:hypothetical protein
LAWITCSKHNFKSGRRHGYSSCAANFIEQALEEFLMNKLLIALGFGTVIALIDVAPMILRKAPLLQIATPFVHWIVVAVLVAYSSMPLPGWAKGLVIGVITTIPFLFVLVAQSHPGAVWTVAGISVVLGLVMGVAIEMALGKFAA